MDSEDSVAYLENGGENTTVASVVPNHQQEEEILVITDNATKPVDVTPKTAPQPDLSEDMLKEMLAAKKKEKQRVKAAERRAAKKSTTSESVPSTGSSAGPEKKRKALTKKTNEKLKRQKLAEDLLKIYSSKKKHQGKTQKKESSNKKRDAIEALIDGNVDDEDDEEEDQDDEDERSESDESSDMEEDETRSICNNEKEYRERKVARAKRARFLVQENVLNRSRLLTIQKKSILIHHCDKCKKRQLERTKELLFKTSINDIYFLQIELCESCLESNFQLSEQYKRIWVDREVERNGAKAAVGESSASDSSRFYISQGEDCTGADDKLMKYKFVWMLHQCKVCVQHQRLMAKDIFVHKIDADMYQLSFVVCGICSVSNTVNQSAINRYFSNFKK